MAKTPGCNHSSTTHGFKYDSNIGNACPMAKKYSDVFSWLGLPIDHNCVPMHSGAQQGKGL